MANKRPKAPARTKPRVVRHYLKEWRKFRDLTQEQLAERLDVSRGLISQYETGETEMGEDVIHAVAHALNCDSWDILRVNPLKEGEVVDMLDVFRSLDERAKAETLGYMRGLSRKEA